MIKSERLTMYPTSKEEMERIIAREPDGIMKIAYREMLDGCLAHPDEWNYYAVWLIEDRTGTAVGDFCFKGLGAKRRDGGRSGSGGRQPRFRQSA